MKSMIRVKIGDSDKPFGEKIVDETKILQLFTDVAQEILIKHDKDRGVLKSYDNIEFLEPVYVGDYIEVIGDIVAFDNTYRKIKFEAKKVIVSQPDINDSAAEFLVKPIVVCRGKGDYIVHKEKQRR